MNTQRMRGLAIAVATAGLLALSAGPASAQASAQHGVSNSSQYGGGWRYGPFADESTCLAMVAEVEQSPFVTQAKCEYFNYSPITGANPDPGWYLWDFVVNPNQ